MRIGLNLLYLLPAHVGGTQTYAESLMEALSQLDSENTYFVFVNQEAAGLPLPETPNFHRVICPCRATSRLGRYAWEQFVFPFWLKRLNIELLHSLGYVCPFFPPCRSIVTIHDINYIGLARAMPRFRRAMLRVFVPLSTKRADHIITISQFSKNEIVRFIGINPNKITITHEAPGARQIAETPVDWDELAMQYALKTPYIIAFSHFSAHKNLRRLIRAYAHILRRWPDLPHDLVLIGSLPPQTPLGEEVGRLGLKERVVTTGYVPDEHILPLLAHADLLAFPSWYEGFGLPILEAQSVGLGIACSRAASLSEVAGDGAVYFNPRSIPDMADTLEKCLRDETLRAELGAKGRRNLERFSWQKTARETLDVYEKVMRGRSAKGKF